MIFSDDLDMAAAAAGGGFAERARAALRAGCDMAVVCNNRPGAIEVVEALVDHRDPWLPRRATPMFRRPVSDLGHDCRREAALAALATVSSIQSA
jgi:beta-N-acetylhexosaminidase